MALGRLGAPVVPSGIDDKAYDCHGPFPHASFGLLAAGTAAFALGKGAIIHYPAWPA
jgi:hypothetical protein